jgi:hypothetical protein
MGAPEAIEAKEAIRISSAALAQAEEELKAFTLARFSRLSWPNCSTRLSS